jgi:hypothetical protein
MHSKICFFEMEDYVEVWIGSHNWTRRAFDGPNLETSIILKIKKQSKIKNIFIDYIENINKLSYRYEEELLDFYKLLQGSLDYFNVIQVEDIKNNFNPYDESIISELVLVIDETGNPIKQNSQDLIYLKIKNNNQIKNYECLIENLGKINQNIIFNTDICIVKNSSNSISNMSDEYITHQKREWLIKNDCHFMLIKVQKKYPYAFSSSKNPDFWVFSDDDVIIKKMDPNHKNLYNIRTKVIKKIEKEIEKEKTRKKSFNSDEDQILLFQENFDKKNSKPFQNRGPKKLLVKIPQKVEYSNDDDIDYQLNGLVEKMSIKRNWGDLYDRFVFLSQERLMRDPDPSLNDGRG